MLIFEREPLLLSNLRGRSIKPWTWWLLGSTDKKFFWQHFKDVWGRLVNSIFLGSCFLLKQLKSFCVGVLRIMALLFGESNCTVESYFFFDGKTFFCFVLNWKVSYLKGHPVFNSAVSIGSKNLTIRGVPVMNKGAFNNLLLPPRVNNCGHFT